VIFVVFDARKWRPDVLYRFSTTGGPIGGAAIVTLCALAAGKVHRGSRREAPSNFWGGPESGGAADDRGCSRCSWP